jgi:hypothetical protein
VAAIFTLSPRLKAPPFFIPFRAFKARVTPRAGPCAHGRMVHTLCKSVMHKLVFHIPQHIQGAAEVPKCFCRLTLTCYDQRFQGGPANTQACIRLVFALNDLMLIQAFHDTKCAQSQVKIVAVLLCQRSMQNIIAAESAQRQTDESTFSMTHLSIIGCNVHNLQCKGNAWSLKAMLGHDAFRCEVLLHSGHQRGRGSPEVERFAPF